MELSEKTTILFPKPLYRGLKRVAKARHVSVGQLVRDACCQQYALGRGVGAEAAAAELAALALPVSDVAEMKAQLTPAPEALLP